MTAEFLALFDGVEDDLEILAGTVASAGGPEVERIESLGSTVAFVFGYLLARRRPDGEAPAEPQPA